MNQTPVSFLSIFFLSLGKKVEDFCSFLLMKDVDPASQGKRVKKEEMETESFLLHPDQPTAHRTDTLL